MFSSWIIAIVGVVFLGVIADIVLPDGQTNKYIKSIFAIITVFVIVSPLPKLFNNMSADNFVFFKNNVEINQTFVDNLFDMRREEKEKLLKNIFEQNGITDVAIEVVPVENQYTFKIECVMLNIKNAVIQNEDKNINIKEKLQRLVSEACLISFDRVIFCE